ncbi:hypothetical protein LINPERHAP2_LOCUS7309 [Linum perenne]
MSPPSPFVPKPPPFVIWSRERRRRFVVFSESAATASSLCWRAPPFSRLEPRAPSPLRRCAGERRRSSRRRRLHLIAGPSLAADR